MWRWFPWSTQSAARPGGGASDVGCASLRPTAGGLFGAVRLANSEPGERELEDFKTSGVSEGSGSREGGERACAAVPLRGGRRGPVRARRSGPRVAAGGGGGSSSVGRRRVGRLAAGAAEATAAAVSGSRVS